MRARTRVRDFDGRVRRVERTAATKAKAVAALKEALVDRDPIPDYVETSPLTTVEELGEAWLQSRIDEKKIRPQSIDRYRTNLRHDIIPALGGYRMRELTAARCERFLRSLTPGSSKEAAKVLRLMLDMAVRHDAIRVNPARQAKIAEQPDRVVEVITVAQVADIRNRVALWLAGEIGDDGKPRRTPRYGPRPQPDLLDIFDLFVATGVRTAELLATDWADIDLTAEPPTLTVTGTLVSVTGQGLLRQPAPKTESGWRVLQLPAFGAAVLERRWAERRASMVFPSEADTYLHPNNVNRVWRQARVAAGYPTVQLRTIRRTVATAIAEVEGEDAAGAQLGHQKGSSVTRRHYIAASASRAPDLRSVLDKLATWQAS
ncbi:MAG: tyrosine-type recombinase/integrase [Gordonia sp. (in: high G+C Gram-positive bacteria)]